MKIMASVGAGARNHGPDIYLVQRALSTYEVAVPQKSGMKQNQPIKYEKLWQKLPDGKPGADFTNAIKRFQKDIGKSVTGVLKPSGADFAILKNSVPPNLKNKVTTVYGILSKGNLQKIRANGKTRAKLALVRLPLMAKQAKSIAKFIERAGAAGLELIPNPNPDQVRIDRQKGQLIVTMELDDKFYDQVFFDEESAYNWLYMLLDYTIWTPSNDPLTLKSKLFDFLKPGDYKMGDGGKSLYGFTPAIYKKQIPAAVADAFTRLQFKTEGKTDIKREERQHLARILYPIEPTVARKMISLHMRDAAVQRGGEFYPLYKAGIHVGLPLPKTLGEIGFKASMILDPNTQTEYLIFEIIGKLEIDTKKLRKEFRKNGAKAILPKPVISIDEQFEPITQTLGDLGYGDTEFSAKLDAEVAVGFLKFKIETHKKPWSYSAPFIHTDLLTSFLQFMSGIISAEGLADQQTSDSSKFEKLEFKEERLIYLDMGTVTFEVKLMNQKKFGSDGVIKLGAHQHFLFDFDADFWDPLLYSLVDDVSDLVKKLH